MFGAYKGGLERRFHQRFASAIGTPNTVLSSNICSVPRQRGAFYTYGGMTYPDYEHPPRCVMVWGRDPSSTGPEFFNLKTAIERDSKFIVVDPRKITLANRADIWLKPRPGSDGLLALGMLKVIVEESLYDGEFVRDWTIGFDQLVYFLSNYTLDEISEKTWVPKNQIIQASRLFAMNRPAAILWGNAIEHTNNAFQTCRAISIMRALTGNLDVPGGEIFHISVPILGFTDFLRIMGSDRNEKIPIGSRFKVATKSNIVPDHEAIKAILEDDPYTIKAAALFGCNPLLSYADANETYRALRKLDFLVVTDFFMNPTVALADVVLPVAFSHEYDDLVFGSGYVAARSKIIEPPGDCLSDLQWINLIARKMGHEDDFWIDETSAINEILKPANLTYGELKRKKMLSIPKKYRKYEARGFNTPSGKVELFSPQLEEMEIDPLPTYNEPIETPYGSPELSEEYPLVATSYKSLFYFHSSHRNISSLRASEKEPIVELNPDTAKKLGLDDDDMIYIETPRGRIKQKLRYNNDLDPRIVVTAFGWWFPESDYSSLFGWNKANLNILTTNKPPFDPAMGSTNLRGFLCKVYRA
jgi:anaerobic selenocysteine-containing dehydrogenase